MSKVSKFVQEVVAVIKGDDAQALALKIERKAKSAFSQQIASLNAAIVDQEDTVDSALEAYHKALYPETQIEDSRAYVKKIADKKAALDAEQEKLETLQESLQFFTQLEKESF